MGFSKRVDGSVTGSTANCLLQGWAEQIGEYPPFSRNDGEKLIDRSGTKNVQKQRFYVPLFFDTRQGNLARGGCMKRIIENRQSRSRLRLGIDSKQYLVGKLIPGRCRGLSEVNVKHVAVGIVSDTGRSHSSPLLSRNLIRCHDEIVFGSVGSEAEPNHGDDRGIVCGQVFEIAIIKEHIGPERVLKPSPSLNRLQNFAFISLHFGMFFANMRPTFIGQINLVPQQIR